MHALRTIAVTVALGTALPFLLQAAPEPANPKAAAKVRTVLAYLAALPDRPDKRVLSGQFTDFGDGSNATILDDTKRLGGHYPALVGADYADFGRSFVTVKAPDKTLADAWKAGSLVTLSAHLPHPTGGDFRGRDVDLDQLLLAGSPANKNYLRALDSMAVGLKALRDAGVVVLWRPFHEMNGEWFWWNGKDSSAFVRVWRHMFAYYSNDKGLDNLLWVYSPNMGTKVTAYYPGAAYVDITGLDAYPASIDSNVIKGYSQLIRLGKPFGFTEFGPENASNPSGEFDYRKLIDGIRRDFPRTCFFMSWNAKWSLPENNFTKELLADPWIVNREDVDLAGGIAIRPDNGPENRTEGRARPGRMADGGTERRLFLGGKWVVDAVGRSAPDAVPARRAGPAENAGASKPIGQ
jgi:mannan endo-1,4-beta-mannosidase